LLRALVLDLAAKATAEKVPPDDGAGNPKDLAMVDELRREMRSEIASLRSEMNDQRQEQRADLAAMRSEILEALRSIQADFNAFRTEVRADLDRLKENDAKRTAEVVELRGELKVIEARINTATAVVVTAISLVGGIVGILAATGVI
jgi:chromosome segregation ATPase